METVKKIWMDGKLKNWEDCQVHVLTHALHYGSAVFEGIRFYETADGPAIFLLKEHIQRLFKSAKAIAMEIPYTEKELCEAVIETIKVNKIKAGYIRPIAFYGYGKMGLNPIGAPVKVAIAIWPWGAYLGEDTIKVKTSSYIRLHPKSLNTEAKVAGHYVNSIMASLEAKKAGCHEALLLDYKGKVAEGPGENIFVVKKGKILTPALGNILAGLTRKAVMQMAKDLGFTVVEKQLGIEDVRKADEAFFTGTAAEVTAIGYLDGKPVNKGKMGPITEKLRALFHEVVQGKVGKYKKWLTYVS